MTGGKGLLRWRTLDPDGPTPLEELPKEGCITKGVLARSASTILLGIMAVVASDKKGKKRKERGREREREVLEISH